jgi:hypothetical protein
MAKELSLAHLSVNVGNGDAMAKATHLIVQDDNKDVRESACSITGKKTKNLIRIEKANGEATLVSMEVLRKAGVTQKDIDRVYNVGYFDGKGGAKKEKADVVAALSKFLA